MDNNWRFIHRALLCLSLSLVFVWQTNVHAIADDPVVPQSDANAHEKMNEAANNLSHGEKEEAEKQEKKRQKELKKQDQANKSKRRRKPNAGRKKRASQRQEKRKT